MSFNPRTHTGCDYPIQKEHYSTIYVSIHAPTRGATAMGCKNPSGISVSIHAPTRGATRKEFESLTDKEFQSTHPHGVRLAPVLSFSGFAKFQSTHPHGVRHVIDEALEAVAGFNPRTHTGCDNRLWFLHLLLKGFQSTHPHGVRRSSLRFVANWIKFQSTHPHGVRQCRSCPNTSHPSFNPRTHTGCDDLL